VPRAKRTDRAEARRRYRASQVELPADDLEASEDSNATEPAARADGPARRSNSQERPTRSPSSADAPTPAGIGSAFRGAYRPANVREDISQLPTLIRSRAVWAPALVSIATAAIVIASSGNEPVTRVLAQFFLVPPPIGAVFIAGFFAPRASYLAGAIVGLIGALGFIAVVASLSAALASGLIPGAASPSPSAIASAPPTGVASESPGASPSATGSAAVSASPSPTAGASASPGASGSTGSSSPGASGPAAPSASPAPVTPPIDVGQAAGYWIALSVVSGSLFGAAAAWYRRFLRLSGASRASRTAPRPKQSARRR
jgi:hypothetical protein